MYQEIFKKANEQFKKDIQNYRATGTVSNFLDGVRKNLGMSEKAFFESIKG